MPLLREGDHGADVESLQRALARAGHQLKADGIFGPRTAAAVRAFQRKRDLVVDGIVGPKTRASLAGRPDARALTESALKAAAETLGVPLAAVHAVNEVESRGSGFLSDGRPVILFERHIMHRRLRDHGQDADAAMRRHPHLVNTDPGGYRGGSAEHMRLRSARNIHDLSALESASWGLFQIMGFHATALGYADAAEFATRMSESEAQQLDAFVRFIQADPTLHAALREQDWEGFARGYNGPGYAANDYDLRMAAAYRRHLVSEQADADAEPPAAPSATARKRSRKRKTAASV